MLFAQSAKEQPVGLILAGGGAKLLRANTETLRPARTGDVLFPGDTLLTASSPATFLFCPLTVSQDLAPNAEVLLESASFKLKSGKLAGSKPVGTCLLPQFVRVAVASQQVYGVSMVRDLKIDGQPVERNQLPRDVLSELAPVEREIASDPMNPANWLAEATVFEKYSLEANALACYRRVAAQWKDALWISGRIIELEKSLATKAALVSAPPVKIFAQHQQGSDATSAPKFIKVSSLDTLGATDFIDGSKLAQTLENRDQSIQAASDRGCTWAIEYQDSTSIEVVFPHAVSGVGAELKFVSSGNPILWMVLYDGDHNRIGMFRSEESQDSVNSRLPNAEGISRMTRHFIAAKGTPQIKSMKVRTEDDPFSIIKIWTVDGATAEDHSPTVPCSCCIQKP